MSLSRSVLWQTALRSQLLQGAWNFDRMQNLGWAFCVAPALKELYPDEGRRALALRRHLEIFNTHPYMAGYVLGAALKVESELADGRGEAETVSAIKARLAPALAAVGDSFYWAALRPATVMLGIAWLWLAPHPWHLWAPAVFLAAYNLVALVLRMNAVEAGWTKGEGVAVHVASMGLPAAAEGVRQMALVLMGALAGSLGRLLNPLSNGKAPLVNHFLFLGSGLVMLLMLRLGVRPVVLLMLCTLGCLMLALSLAV
ncbi:MAG TPA: PTS system mannose/fructose/sorbose family transporter subunit IID [bacterium]|nr:PTS system mannose/fructose/sorbose family transporter subunit IID [bacterium]